jgi:expansin
VTANRLLSARWLATGGAIVLAGVVGVALLLHDGGAACAAPPSTSTKSGKATFYDLAGTQGNCSFDPPADDLYVALGKTQYAGATSCGSYIDVTGPKGKVRVKVFDSCPECPVGHLDLSRTAFKKIANEVQGVVPIKYKAVRNASTPGPMSIKFVEGSSKYWWAVLIDNHANPIKSVQAKGPGGSWMTASHATYNYWIIDRNTGSGPFKIKITDTYGHTVTATNIKLKPNKTQTTSVRLTAGKVVAAVPPKKKKKSKASPSASTSPSASAKAAKSPAAAPLIESTTAEAAPDLDVALAAAAPTDNSCD